VVRRRNDQLVFEHHLRHEFDQVDWLPEPSRIGAMPGWSRRQTALLAIAAQSAT